MALPLRNDVYSMNIHTTNLQERRKWAIPTPHFPDPQHSQLQKARHLQVPKAEISVSVTIIMHPVIGCLDMILILSGGDQHGVIRKQ